MNFKNAIRINSFILLLAMFSFSACTNENDPEPEENEVITTLKLHFMNTTTSDTLHFQSKIIPGTVPVIDEISLEKGVTYMLFLEVLNETLSPGADGYDLTEEIKEKGDEHQFFFSITPNALAAHNYYYLDIDSKGNHIGLSNVITTSAEGGTGQLKVTLKHQPGIKTSTTTINDGTTDLEVNLNFKVQ